MQRTLNDRALDTMAQAQELEAFEPINLDGLTISPIELMRVSHVLQLLSSYAYDSAQAMELRLAGDIDAAMSYERNAEHTYRKLPNWAKW